MILSDAELMDIRTKTGDKYGNFCGYTCKGDFNPVTYLRILQEDTESAILKKLKEKYNICELCNQEWYVNRINNGVNGVWVFIPDQEV